MNYFSKYVCEKKKMSYRWFAVDDFSNKLSVCSVCGTETTFTDDVVLQKALDHIGEGTLNKIPEGR